MEVTRENLTAGLPYRVVTPYPPYFEAGDIIYLICDDGSTSPLFSTDPEANINGLGAYYIDLSKLEQVNVNNLKGGEKMTNETPARPEFIIITRNTEVFKRGGVFKNYGPFYSPEDDDKAFTVKPYGDSYIRPEQVDLLLQKKIAVEAVKFQPEFVTLEQNDALQKVMSSMTKPKKAATKKATAKKD